jgi:hypothetical protein
LPRLKTSSNELVQQGLAYAYFTSNDARKATTNTHFTQYYSNLFSSLLSQTTTNSNGDDDHRQRYFQISRTDDSASKKSAAAEWKLSAHSIGESASIAGKTLAPLYSTPDNEVSDVTSARIYPPFSCHTYQYFLLYLTIYLFFTFFVSLI